MKILTGKGLVTYALDICDNKKTIFMHGGLTRPITQSSVCELAKTYPENYPKARQKALMSAASMDYLGVDDKGLINSYCYGGLGAPLYSDKKNLNIDEMFIMAEVKGQISDLPEQAGLILFSKSKARCAVYAGNGVVIECTLSEKEDGVYRARIDDFEWEYWFEHPMLYYNELKKIA